MHMSFAKHLLACFTLFLCLSDTAFSQRSEDIGTYNNLIIEIPLSDKWALYSDSELRSLGIASKFYHYEVKAGLKYKINKVFDVTAAGGFYDTFNGGSAYEGHTKKQEFRLWQQLVMKHRLKALEIENRLRIEEVTTRNFAVQIRYRPQLKWALNRDKLEPGTVYLAAFDELFLQFTEPSFNRNRVFAGAGYVFSKLFSIQSGWLRQVDYKVGQTDRAKNFLYLQLRFKM